MHKCTSVLLLPALLVAVALVWASVGRVPTLDPAPAVPSLPLAAPGPPAISADPRMTDEPDEAMPNPDASARPIRDLPPNAPEKVSFGVIQFAYRGAEQAPKDSPRKEDALVHARRVLEEAKVDFPLAAKRGDPDSNADLGEIPRGVLEPEVEYVLFTLEPGTVHGEPLDTPRGYWIVRRNP